MFGWQTILKNKHSLVKWLLAMALPVILVAGYLGATSHVTQHANRLKVAVVNLDKPARFEGEQQSVGAKLTDQFKASKKLAVKNYGSEKSAREALKLGQVSSIIVFPNKMTQQLANFKSSGKNVNVKQVIATGNNQFATQYTRRVLEDLVNEANVKLSMGISNDSTLKNLAKQSNSLADKTSDLQANLQAVGNAIDTDTAKDLQTDASDLATQLATYSVELNTAISNSDTDKIKEAAAKINDVSYKMQTTVVGGISNIVVNLNNTQALSQKSGIIQTEATSVKSGQTAISNKLKSLLGDKSETTTTLTQMLTLNTTDIKSVKNDGQVILPQVLAVGVTVMAILFGLVLPIKPEKPEALALEQWWDNFQIAGIMSVVGALLMTTSVIFWKIPMTHFWLIVGVVVLAQWTMLSFVWYLKQLFGQAGWWLATGISVLQLIIVAVGYPAIVQDMVFSISRPFWPLTALTSAVNHITFGGEIQQNVMILVIWWIILTILLVSQYRFRQRRSLTEKIAE